MLSAFRGFEGIGLAFQLCQGLTLYQIVRRSALKVILQTDFRCYAGINFFGIGFYQPGGNLCRFSVHLKVDGILDSAAQSCR